MVVLVMSRADGVQRVLRARAGLVGAERALEALDAGRGHLDLRLKRSHARLVERRMLVEAGDLAADERLLLEQPLSAAHGLSAVQQRRELLLDGPEVGAERPLRRVELADCVAEARLVDPGEVELRAGPLERCAEVLGGWVRLLVVRAAEGAASVPCAVAVGLGQQAAAS
jgi:hypothetical protein